MSVCRLLAATNRPLPIHCSQAGEAQPALLRDGGMVRLWHKPDPQFKVPKAVLYAHLQLPGKFCGCSASAAGG